jgi:hypothetical protein
MQPSEIPLFKGTPSDSQSVPPTSVPKNMVDISVRLGPIRLGKLDQSCFSEGDRRTAHASAQAGTIPFTIPANIRYIS